MSFIVSALMWMALGQAFGGISGTVRDQQGAVLPDVTVTVAGPTLQKPLTTKTDSERGRYVFAELPEGRYVVTFSMTCFRETQRKNIRVTDGKRVTVDVVLRLGKIEPPCVVRCRRTTP